MLLDTWWLVKTYVHSTFMCPPLLQHKDQTNHQMEEGPSDQSSEKSSHHESLQAITKLSQHIGCLPIPLTAVKTAVSLPCFSIFTFSPRKKWNLKDILTSPERQDFRLPDHIRDFQFFNFYSHRDYHNSRYCPEWAYFRSLWVRHIFSILISF